MYNFNQERFGIACQAVQLARVAMQEAVKYANKRKTFGQPLIAHQVIRHKIAEMGRKTMASFCFMERMAYTLQRDPLGETDKSIPRISLCSKCKPLRHWNLSLERLLRSLVVRVMLRERLSIEFTEMFELSLFMAGLRKSCWTSALVW